VADGGEHGPRRNELHLLLLAAALFPSCRATARRGAYLSARGGSVSWRRQRRSRSSHTSVKSSARRARISSQTPYFDAFMIEGMEDRRTQSPDNLSGQPAAAVEGAGKNRDGRRAEPLRPDWVWRPAERALLAALRTAVNLDSSMAGSPRVGCTLAEPENCGGDGERERKTRISRCFLGGGTRI
jgi:hypothetical protein